MRSVLRSCAVIGAGVVSLAAAAQAHTEIFTTVLSGPAEAPPNASPGTGVGTVTFDLDLFTMRVEASFQGLLGTTSASHTHGPTTVPGVGTASVMTSTPSFTGFPLGVTSGVYDHTFDMTQASSYNPSFITANGGSISNAFNTLLQAHRDGRAYLNIHTSAFPGGEIRGFWIPTPGTAMMLAGGVVAGLRRRRG